MGDNRRLGIGGAPTRATTLPEGAAERKQYPIATGVLDYFPDAIVAVAHISYKGNEQHNPGKPLHWDRSKSADEDDTMLRHFLQRGTLDTDGVRHSAKLVWRTLAFLQKEIEAEQIAARQNEAQLFKAQTEGSWDVRKDEQTEAQKNWYPHVPKLLIERIRQAVAVDSAHSLFPRRSETGEHACDGRSPSGPYGGWSCERPKGHIGPHMAWTKYVAPGHGDNAFYEGGVW